MPIDLFHRSVLIDTLQRLPAREPLQRSTSEYLAHRTTSFLFSMRERPSLVHKVGNKLYPVFGNAHD